MRPVQLAAERSRAVLAWLATLVNDPRTERVMMSLIVVNAVILGLETMGSAIHTRVRLR